MIWKLSAIVWFRWSSSWPTVHHGIRHGLFFTVARGDVSLLPWWLGVYLIAFGMVVLSTARCRRPQPAAAADHNLLVFPSPHRLHFGDPGATYVAGDLKYDEFQYVRITVCWLFPFRSRYVTSNLQFHVRIIRILNIFHLNFCS